MPILAIMFKLGWNPIQLVIASLLALDMVGGAVGNAASSVKRFLNREELGFKFHFSFVLIHAIQLFLVAWLFMKMNWIFFLVYYSYLVVTAFIIYKIPLYLRRPTAIIFYLGAFLINIYLITPVKGLEWFIPVFFLKMLVCHCLREEPYRPEEM